MFGDVCVVVIIVGAERGRTTEILIVHGSLGYYFSGQID